jgi:hypothetical protein
VNSIAAVAAALLWIVVVVRIPTLTAGGTQRHLFVALVALAAGVTLELPRAAAELQQVAHLSPNMPNLAKHAAVVIAAGAVREVVRAIGLPPRAAVEHRLRRVFVTAAALVAMIILFVLAPVHNELLPGLTAAAVGEPTLLAYWAVYLAALTSVLVGIGRVTLTSLRRFPSSAVRAGMGWMGAGALFGLAYSAHKAVFLALGTSGIAMQDADVMENVQSVLLAATVLGFTVGLLWSVAVRWPLVRHLIAHRTYRRLGPLWQVYVQAEPGIAFDEADRPGLRDIELRLYRRVIEIRDGMLAVRPYADAHSRQIAQQAAHRTGRKNADLIGEAAWLEVARRAKLHELPPADDDAPALTGGADLADELRVLTRIAKAWPTVQTIADQIDAEVPVRKSHQ